MKYKRGQVTIFIIIAVVIIAAATGYYIFKSPTNTVNLPSSIQPAYTSFLSCLEDDILIGIDVLESQAGYITLPDFEPGSSYMPFSSQLNFIGNPIPYWYYVSGNNIQKEQIPSLKTMENQLADFVEEKMSGCNLENYYDQGFVIDYDEPKAKIIIKENNVELDLNLNLKIEKGEETSLINKHKVIVKSQLKNLYDDAVKVYQQEQENLILENYAVDILRLYAPVDGVELTCSPKVWNADEVFDELQEGIEVNTLNLRTKNNGLKNKENEYFVADFDVNSNVRFINSQKWANSFEVNPSEGSILISHPVGNQPGLGILGFCYVAYHFVYDVKYPVLIQVSSGSIENGDEEIFQFPVAIVLQGNTPRKALDVSAVGLELPELCEHKNTLINVDIYDTDLNPIDADISYECFGTTCEIGKTSSGSLIKEFPQCANGFIKARAKGFEDSKYMYSTTTSSEIGIVLDKLYELDLDLKVEGKNYNKEAIISFVSEKNSKTIVYPDTKTIELSEGQYEIQVYVYKNSTIKLEETQHEQCVDVPKTGVGSIFGLTEQECFDIKIPSQVISNALAGGGKANYYVLESELKNSNTLEINTESLPIPKSIEELQNNYLLFETKNLDIYFK